MAKTTSAELMTPMGVTLGQTYKDEITGFEGIATNYAVFLYGCIQVCLEGPINDKGDKNIHYFDEQRLTKKPAATSGGGFRSHPV